jgi:hypothetical protein
MSSRMEVLFFLNFRRKNAVMRKHISSGKLRQAVLVWTMVLSLVLVWIGAQPRPSDFPRHGAFDGFSAVLAPDHAATLTTVSKINRSAEYRHSNDTDVSPFVSDAVYGPTGRRDLLHGSRSARSPSDLIEDYGSDARVALAAYYIPDHKAMATTATALGKAACVGFAITSFPRLAAPIWRAAGSGKYYATHFFGSESSSEASVFGVFFSPYPMLFIRK